MGFQSFMNWLLTLPVGVRRSMYGGIAVGALGLLYSAFSEGQTIIFEDGSQYELKQGEKVYVSKSDNLIETKDIQPLQGSGTPNVPEPTTPVTAPIGSDEWCAEVAANLDGTLTFGQVYYDKYCTGE